MVTLVLASLRPSTKKDTRYQYSEETLLSEVVHLNKQTLMNRFLQDQMFRKIGTPTKMRSTLVRLRSLMRTSVGIRSKRKRRIVKVTLSKICHSNGNATTKHSKSSFSIATHLNNRCKSG